MKHNWLQRASEFVALSLIAAFALTSCNDSIEFTGSKYDPESPSYFWQEDEGESEGPSVTINNDEQWIGAPCECIGSTDYPCLVLSKIPMPTGTPISGCDNMPTVAGARQVCLRTIDEEYKLMAPWTYFPTGYCALGAVSCEGNDLCGIAAYGDVDSFNECPKGSALLKGDFEYDLMGSYAHLQSRTCAKLCNSDADCNVEGDIHCIERTGVKFCYNEKNFEATGDPVAIAF